MPTVLVWVVFAALHQPEAILKADFGSHANCKHHLKDDAANIKSHFPSAKYVVGGCVTAKQLDGLEHAFDVYKKAHEGIQI